MQEGGIFLLADFAGCLVSVIVAVTGKNDFSTVTLGSLHLGDGCGLGHNDGCRNTELSCSTGNTLSMVSGRGGDNGAYSAVFHQ